MKVIYVDDELSAHINFKNIVENRKDISSLNCFFSYEEAINFSKANYIDCAFLDIALSGKNGIELAKELVQIQPQIELAFISSHAEFTREAYQVGGRAYITKPYIKEEIDKILAIMEKIVHPIKSNKDILDEKSVHILARTFGNFDLLVDGVPVHFGNSKSKELMAFLVHQMGGTVTNPQIFYALWENQEYTKSTSTYVRRTVRALKKVLEDAGIGDVICAQRNSIGLNFNIINCDAYELIHGNTLAINKYNGEYMNQYSWGETSIPLFDRIVYKQE